MKNLFFLLYVRLELCDTMSQSKFHTDFKAQQKKFTTPCRKVDFMQCRFMK